MYMSNKKKDKNKVRVTFTLSPEWVEFLQKRSESTGISMSYMVDKALEKWIRENAPNAQN